MQLGNGPYSTIGVGSTIAAYPSTLDTLTSAVRLISYLDAVHTIITSYLDAAYHDDVANLSIWGQPYLSFLQSFFISN